MLFLNSDGMCHLNGHGFGGFVLMNSYLEMQKYHIRKLSLPQDDGEPVTKDIGR